jgi:hypothetical protein
MANNEEIRLLYQCIMQDMSLLKEDIKALTKAVKALSKHRWIKISEKNPPTYGLYIVIVEKIDCYGDKYISADACFFDGINTWYNAKSYDDNKKIKKGQVIAWRLFPRIESVDIK